MMAKPDFEKEIIAAAARTATFNSPEQILAYPFRGIVLVLNVTAAGGVLNLSFAFQCWEPASQAFFNYATDPTAITGTGNYRYLLSETGDLNNSTLRVKYNRPIPHKWRVQITHGDATSATYNLAYLYLP